MPFVPIIAVVVEAIGTAVGVDLAAGAIGSAVAGAVVGEAVAEGSILATTVGGAILGAGSGALVSAVTGGDVLQGAALGALSGGIGGAVTPMISEAVSAAVGVGNVANGITVALASEIGGTAAGLAQGQGLGDAALGALPGALGSGLFVGSGMSAALSEMIDGVINPEGTEFTNDQTTDTNKDGKIDNKDTFQDKNNDGKIDRADLPSENAQEAGNAPLTPEMQDAIDKANLNKLQLKENPSAYEIWEAAKAAADKGLLVEWSQDPANRDAWNNSAKSGALSTDPRFEMDRLDDLIRVNNKSIETKVNAPVETAQGNSYGEIDRSINLFDPAQAVAIAKDPEAIKGLLEAQRQYVEAGKTSLGNVSELVAAQNADAVQAAEQTYQDTLTKSDKAATAARLTNYEKLQDAAARNQQVIDYYQGVDQKTLIPQERADLAAALKAQQNIDTVMAKYEPTIQAPKGEVNYANYGQTPEVIQTQSAPVAPKVVDASGYDPLSGRTTYNQPTSLTNPTAYGAIGEGSFYGTPTQLASTVEMPSTGLIGKNDIAGYTAQQYQAALADPTIQQAGINVAPLTTSPPARGLDISVPSGTGTTVDIPAITPNVPLPPKIPTQTAGAGTGTGTGLGADEAYIVSPNIIPEKPKAPDIAMAPLGGETFTNTYGGVLGPLGSRGLADMSGLGYYKYGYNPELPFYTDITTAATTPTTKTTPAAAQGGYFDADAYFAAGGLVSQPTPPMEPTVASQPTMAYTDGQGLVGAISAPPGLSPYNSVGSDGPHGSPMAFSPAAAAPTMTPDAPTLAMRNINSSPVAAPISQNPNLGYSLGMSPLSQLKG